MRDRNNPLKNFPQNSFTIIQASHTDFHKEFADLSSRYPTGLITYINNHQFIPLLKVREEDQHRFIHLQISSLPELLTTIECDKSVVLVIEHHLPWFKPDCPDELMNFNAVCRKRALHGGPVVYITAIMDRWLLELDGKADYFLQVGKNTRKGKNLALKEQTCLDNLQVCPPCVMEKAKMYGQTIWRDW